MNPLLNHKSLAGVSQNRWEVPGNLMLDGYSARKSPSSGLHDPLQVRALALDDGRHQAIVLNVDVIGLDLQLTQQIRERLQRELSIHPDFVLISATHTHSGPAGVRLSTHPRNDQLHRTLAELAVATAHEAISRLEPATLAVGQTSVSGLSQNRRDPGHPTPTQLDLILVQDVKQRPCAVLASFPCHPTVLDAKNLELSADYPGAAIHTAEAALEGATVLFLTGACAEINPARVAASFEEVERFGRVLGGAIVRLAGELASAGRPLWVDNLRWNERLPVSGSAGRALQLRLHGHREAIQLKLKEFLAREQYERQIAHLKAELAHVKMEGQQRELTAKLTALQAEYSSRAVALEYRRLYENLVPSELQFLGLSEHAGIIGFPGELFSYYDRLVRDRWAGEVMVAAYTNDYVGYLNPAISFTEGGYEAGRTLFDTSQQARLEDAIDRLLSKVGTELKGGERQHD